MPSLEACRTEIESLHEFFVAWYTAAVDEDALDRIGDALASDFELVSPEGHRQDRSALLEFFREAYGRDDPGTFDIEIRNVEPVRTMDGHALVRYEEWQDTPDGSTGRVSTALLREDPDAPEGLRWLDVHETWLPE